MGDAIGELEAAGYRRISLADALSHGKHFFVLDVRGDDAHDRIPRSQVVKLAELEKESGKLDKTAAIMVVCEDGKLSAGAAATLVKLGFAAVYVLEGGVAKWRARGMPLESDDDEFEVGGDE